jgi:hypothetical protein
VSWAEANPSDPDAGRGLIWAAGVLLGDGAHTRARALLAEAIASYAGTEWEREGIRLLAGVELEEHQYAAAARGFERLSREPYPLWSYLGRIGLERTRRTRVVYACYIGTLIALGGLGLALAVLGASAKGRRRWPPPREVIFVLPISVLLILAALGRPAAEARAITTVAAGGTAIVWTNALYLDASPPRGVARIVFALLGLVQAAGVLFCAIMSSGLWERFVDTLAAGADK